MGLERGYLAALNFFCEQTAAEKVVKTWEKKRGDGEKRCFAQKLRSFIEFRYPSQGSSAFFQSINDTVVPN